MKKTFLFIFACILAVSPLVFAQQGSIWTTKSDCGNSTQDVNHYALGEKVYINGDNFESGVIDWAITGKPGGASCDPNVIVAYGNYSVGPNGDFCFEAYTINLNDCGEYGVDFNGKHDNYRVDLDAPIVPEFGTIVGIATILGAIGAFFIIRRK